MSHLNTEFTIPAHVLENPILVWLMVLAAALAILRSATPSATSTFASLSAAARRAAEERDDHDIKSLRRQVVNLSERVEHLEHTNQRWDSRAARHSTWDAWAIEQLIKAGVEVIPKPSLYFDETPDADEIGGHS